MPMTPKPWQSTPDLDTALGEMNLTNENCYLSDYQLHAHSMPLSVPISLLGRHSAHDKELAQRASSYAKKTGALRDNIRVHSGHEPAGDPHSPGSGDDDFIDDAVHRRALQREKILGLGLPSYSSSSSDSLLFKVGGAPPPSQRSTSDSSTSLGSFDL